MSNGFGARAMIGALLVAAALAGVGYWSYNAGVAHGIAESARIAATSGGAAALPYPYMWHRPWGFGFFPVFPFLFILFWFVVLRGFFWRGRRGWNGWYDGGVPPRFEEWHRRAHERDGARTASGSEA